MSGLGAIYSSAMYALKSQIDQLSDIELQASSGLRILQASDDPSDSNRVLTLQSELRQIGTYQSNLDTVELTYDQIDTVLEEVSSQLVSVEELLTQGVSGTLSDTQQASVADEINSILEELLSLANQESVGQYIFSGSTTSTEPYVATYEDGQIVSVTYQGSGSAMSVQVADGVLYESSLVGEDVFQCDERQAPEFLGNTGAAAGSGTSSVTGDVWLTLEHTETTYEAGTSGLTAGDSSADGDTILGEHTLTITAGNTIQLDDGTAVSFTTDDTDVCVTNADGDVVYVNVSGWSGEETTVTITGQGRASIDDGESWTEITDFTGDVAVTDASTGTVLYVDTTGIERTGTEPVSVQGTYDMFSTLIAIRDALTNADGLDSDTQEALLTSLQEALQDVEEGVTNALTRVGGKLEAIDTLNNSLDTMTDTLSAQESELSDADVTSLTVELSRLETLYQMTLEVTSQILSLSLLDYI